MAFDTDSVTNQTIDLDKPDFKFNNEVNSFSKVNVNSCWHCKSCSGGCPFSFAMDYHPNQVIRLVQLGQKQAVLECQTIWICVGCHTCSTNCPLASDMSSIMDSLRQIALRENVRIAEPDIFNFPQEVSNPIERYGRTHKLEIMLRYKLVKRNWFEDMDVGLKMLAKRKLDLLPSKIDKMTDIKQIFNDRAKRAI